MEDSRKIPALNAPLNAVNPSSNPPLQRHQSLSETERTYIFTTNASDARIVPGSNIDGVRPVHSRSMSHGGESIVGPLRPSLKSALKSGHQRAFSQGQIHDSAAPKSGHSRVGSKTEFILPPSHKDPEDNSYARKSSIAIITGRHSRQASRSESIYTLRRQDLPPFWKRLPFMRSKNLENQRTRNVVPNHTVPTKTPKRVHPNGQYMVNKIRTTKYTLLTFLPKNLIEQFHRVANLYFIFIQCLNWVPKLNVFGKEIAMLPLLFVLGVTAIKDLFEDRRRFASDKRINNSSCRVYHGESDSYQKLRWQDIHVGDIVHLSNNETVPADILLLKSSEPDGCAWIDSCDLDGETNLKRRQVIRGFANKQSSFLPNKFVSKLEIDSPTTKIYRFHGVIVHPNGERVPISTENLLLRESRIKNTSYVEGIVVYAGHETKAMLNNSGPRYKRSQLEQKMNIDVIWCVITLILLCSVGAFGCQMWMQNYVKKNVPFILDDYDPWEGFWMFFRLVIILQILIPLALYVTIEVCKVLQVYIIHNSIDLYDPQTDKRTQCRAMNITEELGQIQYLFSDKTGTLTENRMIFRRCTIAGIDYNHPGYGNEQISAPSSPIPPVIANSELTKDLVKNDTNGRLSKHAQRCEEFFSALVLCNTVVVTDSPHRDNMNDSGVLEEAGKPSVLVNVTSSDSYSRLSDSHSAPPSSSHSLFPLKNQHIPTLSPIGSSAESSPESESPKLEIKAMTPTNRVKSIVFNLPIVPQILGSSAKKFQRRVKIKTPEKCTFRKKNDKPIYEAESPDELALVNSAYAYGFVLVNRNANTVTVREPGDELAEYEILTVLPFDSNRKCMSIVLRRIGGHDVVLYTKGADSTILQSLAPCDVDTEEFLLREQTVEQLEIYARQGLRVLLIAKRHLNPVEFSEWYSHHQQECEMSEFRDKKIRESFGLLERNLTLLGATGIEDRLQEKVPETIASLLAAGIVIWVLTGDKTETAISVATSAKLFNAEMDILKLTASQIKSRDSAENFIKFYMDEIGKQMLDDGDINSKNRGLVVDGKTLTFILDLKSNLTIPFLELTRYCSSVLCCRCTPLQKAFLVKVVKEELKKSTLAIGDGANDVSMIQMADVGVGICGQEGMQAVMASDFAIAKFMILEKLLLVHGHLNYDRLSKLIIYFFYKNATFVFVLFWFQLYCGFSGSVMMEQMYVMIYNFMFTAAPPLAIGAYEKRIQESLLTKYPRLYRYGRLNKGYRNQFWFVMLDSMWQSLAIFFITVKSYEGLDIGIWQFGTTIVAQSLVVMLCHFSLEVRTWTIIHVAAIVLSLSSFYIFACLYNSLCTSCLGLPNTAKTLQDAMSSLTYYFIILLTPIVALLPRLMIKVLKNTFKPSKDEVSPTVGKRNEEDGGKFMASCLGRLSTFRQRQNITVSTIS